MERRTIIEECHPKSGGYRERTMMYSDGVLRSVTVVVKCMRCTMVHAALNQGLHKKKTSALCGKLEDGRCVPYVQKIETFG